MAPLLPALPAPTIVRAGGEALLVRRLGAGPRIVLLHGGPGLDHHLLLPLARPLAEAFDVWLVDLPGHGSAGGPALGLEKTLVRLGHFLAEVQPEVLGGHSLGAFFARELLRAKIVRPRAAILVSPPGPVRGREGRRPLPSVRGATGPVLREALLEELGPRLTSEFRQDLEAAVLRSPEQYGRLVADLLPLLRAAVPSCDPRCPVLVLAGADDRVAPPSVAQAVTLATRGAELQIVPGAGHFPWAAGAAPIADRIRRFLAEHLG
ncbi:alpha/beta fold hydrolase [Vulgatibacter sp.]|uniref:alpha/beta fold hydrolase n=1 Tax=Vulgatibacter sp. TaxID=1971226 RepID=UPI003562972E